MSALCLTTIRQEIDPAKKLESAQQFLQQAKDALGKERLLALRQESSFDAAKFAAIVKSSSPDAKADALLYLNEEILRALAKKVTEAYLKNNSSFPISSLYQDVITAFASAKIFELLQSDERFSSFCSFYFLEVFAAANSSRNQGSLIHPSVHPYFAISEYRIYRA